MVSLNDVQSVNASTVKSRPIVAVFVGGTSGIGEYTIRALATHHGRDGPGLRLYIVGRSDSAARKIIDDCLVLCPNAEFRFVQATDLSLIRDVDKASQDVLESESKEKHGRIDLLVMSHADLNFGARRDTEEGIDKTMSLLYYSRMRLISQLLPLLRASKPSAHVVSVYGAGLEKGLPRWYPDDLSLRDPSHYSLLAYRTHVPVMTTFYFEMLAKQNAERISLSHIFPSLVITPAFYSKTHPLWFRVLFSILGPVLKRFGSVQPQEIGERILFLLSNRYPARESGELQKVGANVAESTDGLEGGGAYSVHYNGEINDIAGVYKDLRTNDLDQKVVNHTNLAFEVIEKGKTFTN